MEPFFSITATDPEGRYQQILLMIMQLMTETLAGTRIGDVFATDENDIFTISLSSTGGLQKTSSEVEIKLKTGTILSTDSGGLDVDETSLYSEIDARIAATQITVLNATPNRVFYSDTSGDIQEVALGAAGTHLISAGTTSPPAFGVTLWADAGAYYKPSNLNDTNTRGPDGSNDSHFRIHDTGAVSLFSEQIANTPTFYVNHSEDIDTAGTFHNAMVLYNRITGTGQREAFKIQLESNGESTSSRFKVGINAVATAVTGTGQFFGVNGYAQALAGADDSVSLSGGEFNTDAQGQVANKTGIQIVDVAASEGVSTGRDAAIWIAKQHNEAKGYKYGIHFAKVTSEDPIFDNHIESDGNLISNVPTGYTHFWQVNNSNVASITAAAFNHLGIINAGSVYKGGGDNDAALLYMRSGVSNISFDWNEGTGKLGIFIGGVDKGDLTPA